MSNDADKIQVPFAPGCFSNDSGYAVAVDPKNVSFDVPGTKPPIPAQP